jgi:CBS domain-containing protein
MPSRSVANPSNLPFCFAQDGILEAMRVMAEKRIRKILVLNESKSVVGAFEFKSNRLQYIPFY